MSKAIINGKKPISSKPTNSGDLFGNALNIPPVVQAELDEKGLVGRWVNAIKLQQMGGYHPKGWQPFRSEKYKSDFKFGSDPDGVIRRGDCILAVKTLEDVETHKEWLANRVAVQRDTNKVKAQEFRDAMRQSGLNSKVVEGYGDDE